MFVGGIMFVGNIQVAGVSRRLCSRAAGVFPFSLGRQRQAQTRIRLFSLPINTIASAKFTVSTGRAGNLNWLGLLPITATHNAWVTGVSNSQ